MINCSCHLLLCTLFLHPPISLPFLLTILHCTATTHNSFFTSSLNVTTTSLLSRLRLSIIIIIDEHQAVIGPINTQVLIMAMFCSNFVIQLWNGLVFTSLSIYLTFWQLAKVRWMWLIRLWTSLIKCLNLITYTWLFCTSFALLASFLTFFWASWAFFSASFVFATSIFNSDFNSDFNFGCGSFYLSKLLESGAFMGRWAISGC